MKKSIIYIYVKIMLLLVDCEEKSFIILNQEQKWTPSGLWSSGCYLCCSYYCTANGF